MIKTFLTTLCTKINTSLILNGQGVSGAQETTSFQSNSFLALLDGTIKDGLTVLWTLVMKLVLIIGRFMLNAIEFLMVFVNQFLGLNNDYQTMSDLTSDKIFSFLLNENVLRIVRYVAVVGIILIILFSIVSIVKSEYQNAIGDSGNSKGRILVSALKALFMMVLVPLISITAIIFSNALLTSLYRATTGGQNVNVSTFIWEASTYSANAYRAYADEGYVRPILYNFTNTNDDGQPVSYTTLSSDGQVSDLEKALLEYQSQSAFKKGFTTWAMFKSQSFLTFNELEALESAAKAAGEEHSLYYGEGMYDAGLYFKRAEYYVCADALDYMVEINNSTASGFFFKSINEIYENHATVYGGMPTDLPIEKTSKDGQDGYQVVVMYSGEAEETVYFSPEGTRDEALGTVYAFCYSEMVETKSGVQAELYVPIINGISNGFKSSYSTSGSLVIAHGVFDQQHNPTAIRTRDDGTVQFYRDDLNIPELVDFFPTVSYEKPEGAKEGLIMTFFRWGIEEISGLDSHEFVPYVYINFDIFEIFTKAQKNIAQMRNGNFVVNYNMSDSIINNTNNKAVPTYNFYREDLINPIILIFSGVILIKMLITITFGLISRIFNMVLLAVTYPAVVSTLALDSGGNLDGWIKRFMDSLFCVYGIVVAFNIMLILIPIIWKIDFFTDQFMIERMGNVFFGSYTAKLLNLLVRVMFTLVGFAMVKDFAKWVGDVLVDPENGGAANILAEGEEMQKAFTDTIEVTGSIISGKALMDGVKNIGSLASDFIPGKAVYTVGRDVKQGLKRHFAEKNAQGDIDNAKQNLEAAVYSGGINSASDAETVAKIATQQGNDAGKNFDKAVKYKPPKKDKKK